MLAEREQAPLVGVELVHRLELLEERLVVGARHNVLAARLHEDFHKREHELQVGRRRREAERVDGDARLLEGDAERASAEVPREGVVTAAQIEDQGPRAVALKVRNQEVQQKRLSAARRAKDQRMSDILDVEVQVVRRAVGRIKDRQRFSSQVGVVLGAGVVAKQQGEIGIVRVKEVHRSDVVRAVPGEHGEPRVQQVVALVGHLRVVRRKRFEAGADAPFQRYGISVRKHDGHRVLAKIPAVERQLMETRAQVSDHRGGAVVDEEVRRRRPGVGDVVGQADFRVMEMAALRVNLASHGALVLAPPLVDQNQARRHLVERLKEQRERVGRRFLEREHAHVVVVQTQMRAVTFQSRIAHVVVQKSVAPRTHTVCLRRRVVHEPPRRT